jgi:hypothetical protein
MIFIDLGLVLIYTSVLLIKACDASAEVCAAYGLGSTSDGDAVGLQLIDSWMLRWVGALARVTSSVRAALRTAPRLFLLFLFFALALMASLLVIAAFKLYFTGNVPKTLLVARVHGVSVPHIVKTVAARRWEAIRKKATHTLLP